MTILLYCIVITQIECFANTSLMESFGHYFKLCCSVFREHSKTSIMLSSSCIDSKNDTKWVNLKFA